MPEPMFAPRDIQQLKDLLSTPKKIIITTHRKPDGDALGSSLGLMHAIKKLGHEVTVLSPTPYDHYLTWLPGCEDIFVGPNAPRIAHKMIRETDIIFCLDFSALSRVESLSSSIAKSSAVKIMIDHHMDPEDFPDLKFHKAGISSTAELVYRVLDEMGRIDLLDREVAECLYTGIMTDTGSFRFSSTTADVHRITAALLDQGIDVGRIHNLVYDNFSEKRNRFLGYALYKKMKVIPELNTAYMVLTLKEMEEFNIQQGDSEGFVNYNLSLKGINFGVLIKEAKDRVKMSFRSIGSFPCNEFAGHFSGGGHYNASGGQSNLSLEETEKRFLELLEEYKDKLIY